MKRWRVLGLVALAASFIAEVYGVRWVIHQLFPTKTIEQYEQERCAAHPGACRSLGDILGDGEESGTGWRPRP